MLPPVSLENKTVLLDMDLMRGGGASYFDLRPKYTIADVMDSADKVDRQLLDNALTIHAPSKLAVLARPDMPEDTRSRINQAGLNRLMGILGRTFEYVVIDSLMSISPIYTMLNAADFNVIVLQLNVLSVRNTDAVIYRPPPNGYSIRKNPRGR